MPLYDFECLECNKKTEELVKFDLSDVPTKCKFCGGVLKKLISNSFSMDFVGPGFYVNDYGKHNWKAGKSDSDIADVLNNKKDPY